MVDKVGKRYAEAIYEIATEEKRVMDIYQLLQEITELYTTNADFKEFLSHPLVKMEDKLALVEKVVADQPETDRNIILYLVTKGRFSDIKDILEEYKNLYYKDNNMMDVKGIFATKLTKVQTEALIKKLEKTTNKKINLEVEIDQSLIGGGILKIGDKILDGSIKAQIQSMAKE